jgi:hypothetical protein
MILRDSACGVPQDAYGGYWFDSLAALKFVNIDRRAFIMLVKKRLISDSFPALWFTHRSLALGTAGSETNIVLADDRQRHLYLQASVISDLHLSQVRPVETRSLIVQTCFHHATNVSPPKRRMIIKQLPHAACSPLCSECPECPSSFMNKAS